MGEIIHSFYRYITMTICYKVIALDTSSRVSAAQKIERFFCEKLGVASLIDAFLSQELEPSLETHLTELLKGSKDKDKASRIEQYFYHTRICAGLSITETSFFKAPDSIKLEFLLTRSNSTWKINDKHSWHQALSAIVQLPIFIRDILWLNTHRSITVGMSRWIQENITSIIYSIKSQETQLKTNYPKLTTEQRYACIRAGLTPSYLRIFKLGLTDIKELVSKNGKLKIKLMHDLWYANEELSLSECKSLAIRYTYSWQNVLNEVKIISEENPDLSTSDCKTLALSYLKTWRQVLDEAKLIKSENPEFTASECKSLAIRYYKSWRDVIKESAVIQSENPELAPYYCKVLANTYYKTWRTVLNEAKVIQVENPDLGPSDCKILAITYHNTWRTILKEAQVIQEENLDLSPTDCKMLAIRHPKSWREVLNVAKTIHSKNPDVPDSACKLLAIKYPNSWQDVLEERKKIQAEYPNMAPSDYLALVIGYRNSWQEVLKEGRNFYSRKIVLY